MELSQSLTSEADLVHHARRGDQAAWEALVHAHQEPVFRLAYLLVGDAAEAEDIAQEAFIRAFLKLDRYDAGRPLRPWLLKIAANLAHNQRRAAGRYLAAVQRWFRSDPRVSAAPAELRGNRQMEAESLWQAVRNLSDADQRIIYLRFFLELSVEETAEAMGIAQGTVKSRLHRALDRLREVVRRDHPERGDWHEA